MGGNNENNNVSKNGWSEYGKLVLKELERLNEGQDNLRKDMDAKFTEINKTLAEFNGTTSEVKDLKEWKEKVTEVWSSTQMQQSKDEIYNQKNSWSRVIGIVIAIQVIFTLIMAFKDTIFK
jgi:hypothetical protein